MKMNVKCLNIHLHMVNAEKVLAIYETIILIAFIVTPNKVQSIVKLSIFSISSLNISSIPEE